MLFLLCLSEVTEVKKKKEKRSENGQPTPSFTSPTVSYLKFSLMCVCWSRFVSVVCLSSVDGRCRRFGANDPPDDWCLCFTDQHEVQEEEEI